MRSRPCPVQAGPGPGSRSQEPEVADRSRKKVASGLGKKDGLHWPAKDGEPMSLFGLLIEQAPDR